MYKKHAVHIQFSSVVASNVMLVQPLMQQAKAD
jgi:hypothetical protein